MKISVQKLVTSLLAVVAIAAPMQSFAMSCGLRLNYDVVRMTSGQQARELYERLYHIQSKELPEDQKVPDVSIDLKEVVFFGGAFKMRVARVVHDNFNLEDITSSEPLYYAQIVVNRKGASAQDTPGWPTISESEVGLQIKLPLTDSNYSKRPIDDNKQDLTNLMQVNAASCEGGVCAGGRYFVKWKKDQMGQYIILPFGSSEGGGPGIQQINVINKSETFWGDVKKTLNWFFNS